MGPQELTTAWEAEQPKWGEHFAEWHAAREEAAPLYEDALDRFLAGTMTLADFRARIDSLGKSHGLWGFRGTGQMFFNQLVKAADEQELVAALKSALPPPADEPDAKKKLDDFAAFVEATRKRAEATGATKPGVGRVPFFVSFFWELANREEWPVFYPNSRDMLAVNGLLDVSGPLSETYLRYRKTVHEVRQQLDTNTWGVEGLLWRLGKGKEDEEPPDEDEQEEVEEFGSDLYASYRAKGLIFPDEVVTSLTLSLATKRFVILSGISGIGKTRIATGLAEHLEAIGTPEAIEVEEPSDDEANVYVKLSAPRLRRGRVYVKQSAREALPLPPRGSSLKLEAELPDGEVGTLRINNLGFSDESRELYLLFFLSDARQWLSEAARPGDYLHLQLANGNRRVRAEIVRRQTQPGGAAVDRHLLIPVRSDWTDPRGLVGYFNPLTDRYVSTDLLRLLLRAADDPDNPYMVILDEMNLARVEYYFSDFLSAIESDEPIPLTPKDTEDETADAAGAEIPSSLELPDNVVFVGTVNVDETTHAFSPKVLDRANVIEFNEVDLDQALGLGAEPTASLFRLRDGSLSPSWLLLNEEADDAAVGRAQNVDSFTEALADVHGILERFSRHFGYRVIKEMSAFVGHALQKIDGDEDELVATAFDLQLLQKVLPKLSGGRELEEPLAHLLRYCVSEEKKKDVNVGEVTSEARKRLEAAPGEGAETEQAPSAKYPRTARKLLHMLDRLRDVGFVSALE